MADESLLDLGTTGGENTTKVLSKIIGVVKNLASEVKKTGRSGNLLKQLVGDNRQAKEAVAAQVELKKQYIEQRNELARLNKELQSPRSITQMEMLQERAAALKEEIRATVEEYRQLGRPPETGGGGGGMGINVGYLGGSATRLLRGMGGAGQGVSQIADLVDTVTDVTDGLSDLAGSLQDILPTLAETGGNILEFSSKIPVIGGSLKGVLASAGVGLTGLLTAALPLGVVVGAVAFLLNKQAQANQAVSDAIKARIDAEQEFAQNMRTMTTEQLEDRRTELQGAIEDAENLQGRWGGAVGQTFDESVQAYSRALGPASPLADAVVRVRQLGERLLSTDQGLQGTIERMAEANPELAQMRAELGLINERLTEGGATAEDLAQAHEKLTDLLQQETDAMLQFNEQLNDMMDEISLSAFREAEDRRIADTRAEASHQADMKRTTDEGNKRIRDTWKEMLKSIADENKDFTKAETEAADNLAKAIKDLQEETAKAEADLKESYMASETKELKRHIKDLAKAETDYQKERLRRLEDLNDALFDAEMKNDVLAFLEAQQQGEKDLRRMAEDHADEQTEQEQQWLEERTDRREQFQQELVDLRENATERQAELQEQYDEEKAQRLEDHNERLAEIRQQAAERIAAEKTGVQEQLAEIRARYAEERRIRDEDRALQDRRTREDNDRRLAQMTEQYNKEIAVIRTEKDKQLAIIQSNENNIAKVYIESAQRLIAQLRAMWSSAAGSFGGGSSSYKPPSSGGPKPPKKKTIFAARGGVFGPHRPTNVTLGEGSDMEAVMPLRRSHLPSGLGGYTFNLGSVTIGSADVTRADVEAAFHEMGLTVAQAVMDARAGYRG